VQLERMERGLLRTGYKARRFVGEMEEIASTYETLGMTEKIYQGAAEMYKLVGSGLSFFSASGRRPFVTGH